MYAFDEIKKADSEIADAIQAEMERQNSHLELIASENWVSKAVMAAMGSPLTNKYAEGYPGSILCNAGAWRQSHGYEPGSWRTSDTWFSG